MLLNGHYRAGKSVVTTACAAAGFPDRDAEALASDLSRLIRNLAANGLVRIEAR